MQYQWTFKRFMQICLQRELDVPTNSCVSTDAQAHTEASKSLCYTRMKCPSPSAFGWRYWYHCVSTSKRSALCPYPCSSLWRWFPMRASFPSPRAAQPRAEPCARWWPTPGHRLRQGKKLRWLPTGKVDPPVQLSQFSNTNSTLFLESLSKNSKLQLGEGDHPNNPGAVKNYF